MIADIKPEKAAYQDEGTEPDVPDLRVNGYALGASSQKRLARVLDDLGHPEWLLYPNDPTAFEKILGAVLKQSSTVFESAIRTLATDGRFHVRADLASKLPIMVQDVVDSLARDPSSSVRAALVSNSCLSPKMLVQLSRDDDELVRYGVAVHRNTPRTTLLILSEDVSIHVAQRAQKTLRER